MKAVSRRFKAPSQGGSMATDCITQVTFQGDGFAKPVVARFDQPQAYAAKTWSRRRRVIIKAEVVRHPGRAPRNNPRFVVTNLPDPPQAVYEFYCGRGDMENRLKELHHGLELDRTSCSRFLANQFRVLLTLAA